MEIEKLVDFDGVILDTKIRIDNRKEAFPNMEWMEFLNNIDWYKLLNESKTINDSIEYLLEAEARKRKVKILTKVHSLLEMQAKVTFLRNQGITLPILFTPPNTKKSSIFIPENGELLIDDTLENLYDWKSAGGTGLYFHESLSPNETFQTANTLQRILEP